MADVADHYRSHLAPVYLWMGGGFEPAVARGAQEADAVLPHLGPGHRVVDLGAGFGMHAVPFARRGCEVIAVDNSARLLDDLRQHAGGLPIRVVEDGLLAFDRHVNAPVDAVLCMGDTLTHLADVAAVEALFAKVAAALGPGGTFVTSFRDYTSALAGTQRFIPVRSDGDRILTCFLEYAPAHVDVHDVLHSRDGDGWRLSVSAYRKLRLAPPAVARALAAVGLSTRLEPGLSGMVRAVATRV
jgi:SAM-dependent methyltransferase